MEGRNGSNMAEQMAAAAKAREEAKGKKPAGNKKP